MRKFTLLIALLITNSVVFGFSGGTGVSGDPWLVSNATELNDVRLNLTAHYKQTADIDISSYPNWSKIGTTTTAGTNFTGTYDGDGHKITGLSITSTSSTGNGLFGVVGSGGVVKNLGVSGTINSSHHWSGLLVGYNYGGTVQNCSSSGSVTSSVNNEGGLIGYSSGTITKSYTSASVNATGSSSANIGGFVGGTGTASSNISECYATGNVTNSSTNTLGGLATGGFIGMAVASISNCYSTGNVTCSSGAYAGGFIGKTGASGSITHTYTNCYSTGLVTCLSSPGGFLGWFLSASVSGNHYNTQTSGTSNTIGGVQSGSTAPSSGIDGHTTVDMKTATTFSSWSSSYWYIVTGSYPKLVMEFGTPTVTGISPTSGLITGGTSVTITGTNLTGTNSIMFGGNAASGFTVNSATQITASSPSGSVGTIHVTVTTPGGTSATGATDQFTYIIVPTISTQAVSNIGSTNAIGNGNITDLGNPNPTAYGICWGTSSNPTTLNSIVDKGAATVIGAFTAQLTGLTPGATYHARAYATNSAGTSYGDDVTFITLTAGTFTGATNSDWATATNWAGGSVPILSTDVTIPSGKTVVINATTHAGCKNLSVSGSLTIQSSASNTGSLLINGTPTGTVNMERYLTGNVWHVVSPTAAGGNISTFIQAAGNAIAVNGSNYGMMDYNEATNAWKSYFTAATSGTLASGRAIACAALLMV